jgi:UPF0271 protein
MAAGLTRMIDLNADVGEGCGSGPDGSDAALIALVSSANIACGGHAGDARSMRRCLADCLAHGVSAGAHPSYPDRQGFGRRALDIPPGQLHEALRQQILSLAEIAGSMGVRLGHVKPHGALYNQAAVDEGTAELVVDAVISVDPGMRLVGLPGSRLLAVARARGLGTLAEGFADRRYTGDGRLVPRSHPRALIEDPAEATAQVVDLLGGRGVWSVDGTRVSVSIETVCIHGDGVHALDFARGLRRALEAGGVRVRAPSP